MLHGNGFLHDEIPADIARSSAAPHDRKGVNTLTYQTGHRHPYDTTSPEHQATMGELQQSLHQAGALGEAADQEALRTIQQQIGIEAITAGFRDSFLLMCVCFLLATVPIVWFFMRRLHSSPQ